MGIIKLKGLVIGIKIFFRIGNGLTRGMVKGTGIVNGTGMVSGMGMVKGTGMVKGREWFKEWE